MVVLRGGGRDPLGNPKPVEEIPVEDCLIAPRSTAEPLDRSDTAEAEPSLYHDSFGFRSTDQIRVPDGARMAGLWAVDGIPGAWPFGVEVPLRRA